MAKMDFDLEYQTFLDKVLYYPINYTEEHDHYKFCRKISDGLNYWLNIPDDKKIAVDKVMDKLYAALYCIDDVLDNTPIRNGRPSAYVIYGKPYSISSTFLLFAEALKDAAELGHPDASKHCVESMILAKQGECLEIYFREFNICPTIEMTKKIASLKMSGFMLAQLKVMQLFSENKTDYVQFINDLSYYIMLVNDYAAFAEENYQDTKGYLSDISEGKFTLPVVHAINQELPNPKIQAILNQRTKNIGLKKIIMESIKKHKSLDYVKNEINTTKKQVKEQLKEHGQNPIFEKHFNLNNNSDVNYV